MNAYIKMPAAEQQQYCRLAAEKMKVPLPPAIIEKDFWVCWILHLLKEIPELRNSITFKGGTSLSKGWNMIDRFSEDIDIAVNRSVFGQEPPFGAENATSNRQRKLLLAELEEKTATFIRDQLIPRLQEQIALFIPADKFTLTPVQKGNEVNIVFEYPGTLKNETGGLLPVVLIEIVPRADDTPNEVREITPFIYETFPELDREGRFRIPVLNPERTFLEKLLFIHETLAGFNKGSERKSRHFYDLYKLSQAAVFEKVKQSPGLFKTVVEHRQTFFRYNTLDYSDILQNGVNTVPSPESIADWRSDYEKTTVMIYNTPPSFEELMNFAVQLEKDFNGWLRSVA